MCWFITQTRHVTELHRHELLHDQLDILDDSTSSCPIHGWSLNVRDNSEAVWSQDDLVEAFFSLTANASASSDDVTASKTWLQVIKHIPMWFLSTTPTPILEEGANKAASTLIKTVPSGGVQWGKEFKDTRLWTDTGLHRCCSIHLNISFNLLY
jgi:hypothetical protein